MNRPTLPFRAPHPVQGVLLLLAALGLPAAGCAGRKSARLEGAYELGEPGPGWSRVAPGGADRAWWNASLSATIYGDSNCLERYEDSELTALLTHLTFGIAQGEPLRQEPLTLSEREGLLGVWDGALDGVAVRVGAATTKKDACTYDLLYIAPPVTFDKGWSDFESVLAGFRTRGG